MAVRGMELALSDLASSDTPVLSNHKTRGGQVVGANNLFLDGHVGWAARDKLTFSITLMSGIYLFVSTN